jgi:putative oxidoreductase
MDLISVGMLIFRILYGISLIPHGIIKTNKSANAQLKGFMKQLGINPIFVDLSMLVEIISGILVILGSITLLVSTILIIFFISTTFVSIFKMKKPLPTGINPGYDLDILFLSGAILLLIVGPGELSLFAGPQLSQLL